MKRRIITPILKQARTAAIIEKRYNREGQALDFLFGTIEYQMPNIPSSSHTMSLWLRKTPFQMGDKLAHIDWPMVELKVTGAIGKLVTDVGEANSAGSGIKRAGVMQRYTETIIYVRCSLVYNEKSVRYIPMQLLTPFDTAQYGNL